MTNSSPEFFPTNPLPSPYLPDEHFGLMHLPRIMEKLLRVDQGVLEPYYEPTVGQGFDRMLVEHLGVPLEFFRHSVKLWVNDRPNFFAAMSRRMPADADAATWNRRLVQRGLRGYGLFRLQRRKKALGLGDREDIRTMIDLIEFVEGRM